MAPLLPAFDAFACHAFMLGHRRPGNLRDLLLRGATWRSAWPDPGRDLLMRASPNVVAEPGGGRAGGGVELAAAVRPLQ
jgi:hypothetical protein